MSVPLARNRAVAPGSRGGYDPVVAPVRPRGGPGAVNRYDDDSTVQYTYDSLGRVLTETEGPNPLNGQGKVFSCSYNGVDSIVTLTFPDGTVENRTRDAVQRLATVAVQGGSTLASYQYSGSRVLQVGLQNGVTRFNTFDALWRETFVEYKNGGNSLRKFEYVFNAADFRLLEKRHHATGVGDNYSLDSLYRTVQVKEGVADPVAEYQNPGSQTFVRTVAPTYDVAQNRTQVAVTPSGGSTTTTTYTADALNFYTSVGGTTHVRDANGNLRDDGSRLYEYDYRNQLCRVKDKSSGNTIAEFRYDALGRRIEKSTPTASRSYYWAFEAMAAEYDSSGLFGRRHFGGAIDEIVAANQRDLADLNGNSSTTDFVWLTPAYDGAMDCAAVVGPSGTVVESYVHSYDGVVTITNGTGQTISASAIGWQQGYAGMHRDDETGLLYARLRYYAPAIGRWTGPDPVGTWGDSGGAGNLFHWVGNGFRNGVDPWGLARLRLTATGSGNPPSDGTISIPYNPPAGPSSGNQVNSLAEAIEWALSQVGPCDCIENLVLHTHGGSDEMSFSYNADGSENESGTVQGGDVGVGGPIDDLLKKLGKKMCDVSRIVLEACNVATGSGAGPNGLPQRIANLTGHGVAAFNRTVQGGQPVNAANGAVGHSPR